MDDIEFIQVELLTEELEMRWSDLVKKLLEIDEKTGQEEIESVQRLVS